MTKEIWISDVLGKFYDITNIEKISARIDLSESLLELVIRSRIQPRYKTRKFTVGDFVDFYENYQSKPAVFRGIEKDSNKYFIKLSVFDKIHKVSLKEFAFTNYENRDFLHASL